MKKLCISAFILLILAATASASDRSQISLIAIDDPPPATVASLLADGVMVVREMDGYVLVAAAEEDMRRFRALDLAYEVLDGPIGKKTYYTVAYRDAADLRRVETTARILKLGRHSAVMEATADEAEAVSAAGLEIAFVFMRPIRLPAERRARPPAVSSAYNSRIQTMVDAVSSAQIDAYVQRLQDFETRYSFHDSCAAAAAYIAGQFQSFGIDSVRFHHFQEGYNDNVVAVIPGLVDPNRQVLIGGHYDSVTYLHDDCPGADDNASGTSCVLECARILSSYSFDYTIVFVAFCGEEQGLRGSEAYAAEAAARQDDIMAMVNVDMIGFLYPNDALDLDIIDNVPSLWLRDRAMMVAATYVPELSVVDGMLPGTASSDHASFWAHGFDAIMFFEDTGNYSPFIHTVNDVVGISYNSSLLAERSVKTAVALVADLAVPTVETAVAEVPAWRLAQNVPNPFNPSTVIRYTVASEGPVSLRIYDVRGALVRVLSDGHRVANRTYEATWDGTDDGGREVASGVYFYRLAADEFSQTRKMVFLK